MITTSGRVSAVLLDIQGTLLAADGSPVPGAGGAVVRLRELGMSVRYVTNIDSVRVTTIVERLRSAGIPAETAEVFSPVSAAKRFLEAHGGPRVHLLVPPEIESEFSAFTRNGRRPEFVIVGDCRDGFTWARLNEAFRVVEDGAEIVALQKGRYFQTPDGDALDTGAFVSALEYASGKQAFVLGKPSTELLRMAIASAHVDPWETIMVGDDVVSDVTGAFTVGCRSVLVRTGKFSLDKLERAEHKPDLLLDSVADLPDALSAL
jgi:HAD superfamily hydrolase (TIGR01458 family)